MSAVEHIDLAPWEEEALEAAWRRLDSSSVRESCVPNKAGKGHHEEESGHPCSPDGDEGGGKRQPGQRLSPGGKPKSKEQRAASRFRDQARRRRVIAAVKREGELARAIGGVNLPDSEPADVVHAVDANGKPASTVEQVKDIMHRREQAVKVLADKDAAGEARSAAARVLAQPCEFIEVKTILTARAGAVHMSAAARARKERWQDKYRAAFSLVAIDDRRGKKHSGHRVHVAVGELAGTFRLENMHKAKDMAEVLHHVRGGGA